MKIGFLFVVVWWDGAFKQAARVGLYAGRLGIGFAADGELDGVFAGSEELRTAAGLWGG
jgi:hypothetical protein